MSRARRILALAALALAGAIGCSGAEPPDASAMLVPERTIALSDVRGRIDHLAIDLARGRLFVAELGNGSVEIVDLGRGVPVKRITGLSEPQGIAWLPATDQLAVASGGDGTVRFYRGSNLVPGPVLALGPDADNARVDGRTGMLVVGYGSGSLAVIDPASHRVVRQLRLPGHPEGFQIRGDRVLVNVPDDGAIVAGNLRTGAVLASWKAAHGANFPLALDDRSGIAAIAYRRPRRLATMSAATGAILADVPACGDADDLFFDTGGRRIVVICGSGEIDLFGASPGPEGPLGRLASRSGARTGLLVPERQMLFVALPASAGHPAEIRSYRLVG